MRLIRYGACLLLLATFNAFAGTYSPFFNPYVEPTNPTSHENVRWIAQWDGCGSLGTPTISRLGGRIDVWWPVERFCGIPILGGASVTLGQLPEGTYSVHVVPCDIGWGSFPDRCYVLPSPEDVSFTVVSAASVPTLERAGSIALALLLILIVTLTPSARANDQQSREQR